MEQENNGNLRSEAQETAVNIGRCVFAPAPAQLELQLLLNSRIESLAEEKTFVD